MTHQGGPQGGDGGVIDPAGGKGQAALQGDGVTLWPTLPTDLFEYKFINSRVVNSTFLHNKEGCQLDFSDDNNAYMIYFVSFLGTLAVLPGNIVSALLMDKIGRLRMLGGQGAWSGFGRVGLGDPGGAFQPKPGSAIFLTHLLPAGSLHRHHLSGTNPVGHPSSITPLGTFLILLPAAGHLHLC